MFTVSKSMDCGMVSPLFLMAAFSGLGIEPIRFWSVDREIDFHAFRRRCFNACSDWGSGSAFKRLLP